MLCRSGMILMYAICKRQRWPCMPKEAHLSLTLQCCAYRQIKIISLDCYYLLYQLSLKVLEQIIWMAWQPFCCKIIATHLAAINSKQRSALAGWRWADCHLKCAPTWLWLHKGERPSGGNANLYKEHVSLQEKGLAAPGPFPVVPPVPNGGKIQAGAALCRLGGSVVNS